MKEDTKNPEEKEKQESPRKGGKTRSCRTVKKPKWLGHNVMVSAIKKAEAKYKSFTILNFYRSEVFDCAMLFTMSFGSQLSYH